jgi:hypothetical protein
VTAAYPYFLDGRNLTPMLLAYERRTKEKVCICPSHASNRGECPIHDDKGRVRP